jgi:hypothetical protein
MIGISSTIRAVIDRIAPMPSDLPAWPGISQDPSKPEYLARRATIIVHSILVSHPATTAADVCQELPQPLVFIEPRSANRFRFVRSNAKEVPSGTLSSQKRALIDVTYRGFHLVLDCRQWHWGDWQVSHHSKRSVLLINRTQELQPDAEVL